MATNNFREQMGIRGGDRHLAVCLVATPCTLSPQLSFQTRSARGPYFPPGTNLSSQVIMRVFTATLLLGLLLVVCAAPAEAALGDIIGARSAWHLAGLVESGVPRF